MLTTALPARVGVIGDVHAEHLRLEAALDHLAARGVGAVLCVGDLADGPGSLPRCVELLRERHVITVRGNHDRWLLAGTLRELPEATRLEDLPEATRAYLEGLPVTRDFSSPLGGLLLCHGLGENDMAKVGPEDFGYSVEVNDDLQALVRDVRYRLVVNGHSHRAMVREFTGLTVINGGTLRGADEAGFLSVDFETRQVELFRWTGGAIELQRREELFASKGC
jgi:predicted phosphodiesterase